MFNKFKKIGSSLSLSLIALSFSFCANADVGDCAATYIIEEYQWGTMEYEIPALANGEIIYIEPMIYQYPSYIPTPGGSSSSSSFTCKNGVTNFSGW